MSKKIYEFLIGFLSIIGIYELWKSYDFVISKYWIIGGLLLIIFIFPFVFQNLWKKKDIIISIFWAILLYLGLDCFSLCPICNSCFLHFFSLSPFFFNLILSVILGGLILFLLQWSIKRTQHTQQNPIRLLAKDQLGRSSIVKQLVTIIESGKIGDEENRNDVKEKSLGIGLIGDWGSGKTWVLESLKQELNHKHVDIVEFNPWAYTEKELIEGFFSELETQTDISLFPYSNNYLQKLGYEDSRGIIKSIKNLCNINVHSMKQRMSTKFEKYNKHILIFIDDLDRCSFNEIMLVYKLIKNIFSFPNLIFLIAYDEKYIGKILQDNNLSTNYPEKIINHKIYIPADTSCQIKLYNSILKKEIKDFLNIDNQTALNIPIELIKCIQKENKRFINKLMNNFRIERNSTIGLLSTKKDLYKDAFFISSCLKSINEMQINDFVDKIIYQKMKDYNQITINNIDDNDVNAFGGEKLVEKLHKAKEIAALITPENATFHSTKNDLIIEILLDAYLKERFPNIYSCKNKQENITINTEINYKDLFNFMKNTYGSVSIQRDDNLRTNWICNLYFIQRYHGTGFYHWIMLLQGQNRR